MKKERPLIRYEKLSREYLVAYCRVYRRRIHNDEVLFNEIYKDIESLKSDVGVYKAQMNAYKKKYLALLKANTELEEENRKLRDLKCVPSNLKTVIRIDKENERLEEENKKLREEMQRYKNTEATQKSKTITVTDEDNRIILEKGEDGKRHSYWGRNVVLC